MNFQLDEDLKLYLDSFRSTFMHMSHLFVGGLLGMVFEHLWDVFDLKDSTSNFI
jgi:hypothetical protein